MSRGGGVANLNELNAFAEVARWRSFAKAADHLGVSRSALSETIRNLEERLGVRLLNRTTRSVALSDAGERLLAGLKPALEDLEAAIDAINPYREALCGRLRLTIPPPATRPFIEPVLAKFITRYPAVNVEISVDGALVDIVRDRFDAGVRVGEMIDRDMIALRFTEPLRMVTAATPAYLASAPPLNTPEDLKGHNCIGIRFPSGVLMPWLMHKSGVTQEAAVNGRLIVSAPELQAFAGEQGVGLIYTTRHYIEGALAQGRLVTVLDEWMPPPLPLYLYYPSRRQIPAPLHAFIELLREEKLLQKSARK